MFRIPFDFLLKCSILKKTSFVVRSSQKKDFADDVLVVDGLLIGIFDAIFGPLLVK